MNVNSLIKKNKARKMVKEALDNLPGGIVFFDVNGVPILCNRVMYDLSYTLLGRNLQYLDEFLEALEKNEWTENIKKEDEIYVFPDNNAWIFSRKKISIDNETYTEIIASRITELCDRLFELRTESARLEETISHLKRLSSNILAETREEEILSMKMRVHDKMGRSLIAARKLYSGELKDETEELIIETWKGAINLLKSNDETTKKDMIDEIRQACEGMIEIIQHGEMPENEDIAYLIVVAIRECTTNAIRYGHASVLTANISKDSHFVYADITNNGDVPDEPVKEGGGLSNLRKKIEARGGEMAISSEPQFKLSVMLPIQEED